MEEGFNVNSFELEKLMYELIALPHETEWVEFKLDRYDPQQIGEYISALSNSACLHGKEAGYLIFGIEDESHAVKGTSFEPDKEKIGNQEIENWLATQLSPRIDFEIIHFIFHEVPIALFRIDPTYNTPVSFKGEAYIRVGSYKKKLADHPEKARKIWIKTKNQVFERGIAFKNVSADEVLKLLDYPSYFILMNLTLPDNKAGILAKLLEEDLIVQNKGKYHITNLGAILFATNLDLFEGLARKAVRVIIYKGKNKLKTIKEQRGHKGYANGFEGLVTYINDQLPTNEEIGKAFRREEKMYPELAIRELVANALIHQDFTKTGTGPMVEIFENRVEITNPGKPLIDTLRFIDHSPQSRNEKLAYFMRRVNICEERGSGIDKVVNAVESYQLPAPNFVAEENFLRVILYAYKSLKEMTKDDKIRACYQHCCLKYVSSDFMTNQSMRQRFQIEEKNYSTASRIIADTIRAGLIKDYDPDSKSKKFARYIPIWA
ncbi:MAG: ATP-binding protein [Syntrophomonadaceae bacterium]|nr:ATP-binding protein [Syntrophomonadaceae bacterium]